MLKVRLQRIGRKNDASFRVVVIESQRGPKAGNALEVLGFYDPKKDIIKIKSDRITHWMNVGAQVSPTVHNLLINEKIISGDKINVLSKKSPIKKKEEETKDDLPAQAGGGEEKPAVAVGSGAAKPSSAQGFGAAKEEAEKKSEKANDKNEVKEKVEEAAKKEKAVSSEVKKEEPEEEGNSPTLKALA